MFQTCKSDAMRVEEKTCGYCRYTFSSLQKRKQHSCSLKPLPPDTQFFVLKWRSARSKIAQSSKSLTELEIFELCIEEGLAIEGIFPPLFRTRGTMFYSF